MTSAWDLLVVGAGPAGASHGGRDWRGARLPLSTWRWRPARGPVLLAGDAAGLVNPMTGEGIYYAVATGLAAGRAAARAIMHGGLASGRILTHPSQRGNRPCAS